MNIGAMELIFLSIYLLIPVTFILGGYFIIKIAVKNAIKELKKENIIWLNYND